MLYKKQRESVYLKPGLYGPSPLQISSQKQVQPGKGEDLIFDVITSYSFG